MNKVRLLSLNVGNPSLERARKQCLWLEGRQEDIFVLTETRESRGCEYIKNFFGQYAYNLFPANEGIEYFVNAPKSQTDDLGVIIISKYPILTSTGFFPETSIYFSRQAETSIKLSEKKTVDVVGLYVPSRDRSDRKILRKKKYIDGMEKYIRESSKTNRIILGDLNILERDHVPHYSTFYEWEYHFYDVFMEAGYVDAFQYAHPAVQEYSWVGRTNNGYRYDYCFVSPDLRENISECQYIHETRMMRITDHSAIVIEIAV